MCALGGVAARSGKHVADGTAARGTWLRGPFVVGTPALTAMMLGLWRAGTLSLWQDEAVTSAISHRPVGRILALLGHVDAEHGAYYLVMHFVMAVIGASELALRLPSVAAFSAASGAVAVLTRKLASPLAGLLAGLLFAVAPFANWYAHDARPYAISAALAVLVTLLFVRALECPTWCRCAVYGACLAIMGAVHLFALLIVPAQLVTLLIARRNARHLLPWGAAVAAAVALVSPLIAVAARQQGSELWWLSRPRLGGVTALAVTLAGSRALLIPVGATALAAVVFARGRRPGRPAGGRAAWLVLPPAILLLASQFHPVYANRYTLWCLPALSVLAGAGLAKLPRGMWAAPLAVVVVMTAPVLSRQLQTGVWPGELREATAVIQHYARPGDGVVYLATNRRLIAEAYPAAFARLRDLALRASPDQAANIGGIDAGPTALPARLRSVTRAWLIEGGTLWRGPGLDPVSRAKVEILAGQCRMVRRWHFTGVTLTLFTLR